MRSCLVALCALGLAPGCGSTPDSSGSITLVEPATDTTTRARVLLRAVVTGTAPDRVDFLNDGTLFANVGLPYEYQWDTSSEPEGTHSITARATIGSRTVVSAPRTITVDRAPLTVVEQAPLAEARVDDPIRVRFSRPLLPAAQQAYALTVKVNGTPAAADVALDPDAGVLTATLKRPVSPPGVVEVALSGTLTDVLGNTLALTGWTYAVPTFLRFPWSGIAVGVAAHDRVWVADYAVLREFDLSGRGEKDFLASGCAGLRRTDTGEVLFVSQEGSTLALHRRDARAPSGVERIGAGIPGISWEHANVFAKSFAASSSRAAALQIREWPPDGGPVRHTTWSWDGSAWSVGEADVPGESDLLEAAGGAIYGSTVGGALRVLSGRSWADVPGTIGYVRELAGRGDTLVRLSGDTANPRVYTLGPSGWFPSTIALSVPFGVAPALALDLDGRPIVAVPGSGGVDVWRADIAGDWTRIGTAAAVRWTPTSAQVTVDALGHIILYWDENTHEALPDGGTAFYGIGFVAREQR